MQLQQKVKGKKTYDGQCVVLLPRATKITVSSDNDVWNCGSILDVLAPTMRLLQLIPWFVTHAHKAFEQNCHWPIETQNILVHIFVTGQVRWQKHMTEQGSLRKGNCNQSCFKKPCLQSVYALLAANFF